MIPVEANQVNVSYVFDNRQETRNIKGFREIPPEIYTKTTTTTTDLYNKLPNSEY